MRVIGSRAIASAMILGAALAVAACGSTEKTDTVDNSQLTDINAVGMEGTTNDMSTIDSATGTVSGTGSNMAMDNMVMDNMVADNVTGNAM